MTEPTPKPQQPLDLNALQASDVTVPKPEFPTPSPPETGPAPRRAWRARTRKTPQKTPQKTVPRSAGPVPASLPKPKRGAFVKPLTQMYTSVGIILMPIDAVCANAFIENAEPIAKAWDDAAYESDAVRKFLTDFLRASIATRITIAHVPLLMAIAIHHSKYAQNALASMGQGFAETVENNLRVGDMGNGVEEL